MVLRAGSRSRHTGKRDSSFARSTYRAGEIVSLEWDWIKGKRIPFIVSSALENAEKSLRRHETVALAREDATRFIDALSDPPAPNERLRAALEEHARRVDSR